MPVDGDRPGSPRWWRARLDAEEQPAGRGRPPMPLARIVEAALALVDDVGAQEFSMRALADRLGSSTATLSLFEVLRAHPKAAVLFLGQVPVGPNALLARERALMALLAAGLSPLAAAQTYTAIARYVIGFGLQLSEEAPTSEATADDLTALYRSLDPHGFPATVSAADSLPRPLVDEFHFGLDLILRGIRDLQRGAEPA